MRITIVLILTTVFHMHATNLHSQTATVNIFQPDLSVGELISVIEKQTNYLFLYNEKDIDLTKQLHVNGTTKPVNEILKDAFSGTDISYSFSEDYISLRRSVAAINQQDKRRITGAVKDLYGDPIIGVNVIEKGTTNGVVTDIDGNFSLSIPEDAILLISYIGYINQEIPVRNRTLFSLVLEEDLQKLDDVVVIGYGTVKKRDLTGSVASIDAGKIASVPVTSVAESLQGRIAGVLVSTSKWAPGETPDVMIRGKRSITASNDPLYVVDGIPITGGMGEISPSDIESMEVLKDASATAIYGARGANGVIIITTKQGKEGKTQIDYNGYVGAQTILNQLDLMNGAEYAEYVRDAYRNTTNMANLYMSDVPNRDQDMLNTTFKADQYVLNSVLMGYDENGNYDPSRVRGMNWMDHVTRTGMVTDHQINIRGGSSKTNFLASATYNKNLGIFKDEDYERYSFRVNLNHEINRYVKFGVQTQYSRSLRNRGSSLPSFWRISPLGSLYEEDGSLTQMIGGNSNMWNPLLNLVDGVIERPLKTSRYLGSYYAEVKLPFEGLKYRVNLGIDSRTVQDYEFYSGKSASRQNGSSTATNSMEKYSMFTLENLLFYDKQVGNHSFGVTLLQSIQEDKMEKNKGKVDNLPSDVLKYHDIASALIISELSSGYERWTMASFMGRLNYSYLGKYLLTISARYDGSSRLAEGHKWVLFPSAALAWRMSDEGFMQDVSWLDNLKLRVGFGKTGNSSVEPYQTKGGLKLIKYSFDNGGTEKIGYGPDVMANSLLTWETTEQWNVGVDFSFFKGRINGTVDLYLQNTRDLLLERQLPVVSGFSQVLSNVGETRNKGIEISLTTQNVRNKNFQWSTDWMIYSNKEEIVSLYNGKLDDKGNKWFIGKSIDVHYDYNKIGIWQDTPEDHAEMEKFNANGSNFVPGSIRIEDVNKDYKITDEDKKILGSERPKVIASLVNNFYYKNFDVSVFIYASTGAMLYNNVNTLEHSGRLNSVKVDYWTPNNPTNAFPQPSVDFERPPYVTSLYYEKASFLRLKTVTLGYTLPDATAKKIMAKRVRFYLTAENPYIFTNYTGIDPEGAKGNTTPSVSSWIFGVNLSL